MKRAIITVLVLFPLVSSAFAQEDWPHIRGYDYTGRSSWDGMVSPWPAAGPKIQWKKKIGSGYSSFAIANGKVFTQMQTRAGQYVLCIDLETGKEAWRARYNWPWELGKEFPGPFGTPTYCDGRIFFTGCYGTAGCLDAKTGKFLWTLNLMEVFQTETPGFGYACTPLALDDRRQEPQLRGEVGLARAIQRYPVQRPG